MENLYDYEFEEINERFNKNLKSFKLAGAYISGLFILKETLGLSSIEILKNFYELFR